MEVETSSWYVDMFLELRHIELDLYEIYYSPMTVKRIINLTTSIYINSKSWENNELDHKV